MNTMYSVYFALVMRNKDQGFFLSSTSKNAYIPDMNRTVVSYYSRRLARSKRSIEIGRRYTHARAVFDWEDPLSSASLFTQTELGIQETAHAYCQERMLPRVLGERLELFDQ